MRPQVNQNLCFFFLRFVYGLDMFVSLPENAINTISCFI